MKKILPYLLALCLLATCLVPGSDCIVQAQAPHPLPDGEIVSSPVPDIVAQTMLDVKSFDCSAVTIVPIVECQALVDLYESTNGAGWLTNTNWLSDPDISTWYGITESAGHVTIVSLYSNQLSGTLPESIGQLPNLKLLELASNQITGPIPDSLGNLTHLEEACFTNNSLTGPIPDTLDGMSSLLKLSFNENQLSGEIPASLGNLTNLTKFSLGYNQLSGSIPDSLGQLIHVERIEVYKNKLSGELPESLGNLSHLEELVIFENSFNGSIPLSYTNLTHLELFDFRLTNLCEPSTSEFLAWKALVGIGWHGTDLICMDFHCFMPIISR